MGAIRLRKYPEYEFEVRMGKWHDDDVHDSPVEYLNGRREREYEIASFEVRNWHLFALEYRDLKKAYEICRFDSALWGDVDRGEVLDKVLGFRDSGYSTTPLFDFEIYAMSCGWRMLVMGGCNANKGPRIYDKGGKYMHVEYGVQEMSGRDKGEYYKFSVNNAFKIFHLPVRGDEFAGILSNFE